MANILLEFPSFPDILLQSPDSAVFIPTSETFISAFEQPNITIIGAAAFLHVSKLLGSSNFELCLCSLDIQATLQNLQKLLTFLMFPSSIINLPIFSAKPKLKSLLLIVLMTSKSIWKKVLNLWLALYTLFWYLNKRLSRNSLRKTLIQVSSDQLHLCIVYQSYLLRKKMVHYVSMLTSTVLTVFPKKITICSLSSLIY